MYSGGFSPHGQRSFPSGPATAPSSLTSPAPWPWLPIRRPARWARGLLFARGFLLLGPPAMRVEGALRTGRVVRSHGRGGLGRVLVFPGIRENRRGLGRLVAFGL